MLYNNNNNISTCAIIIALLLVVVSIKRIDGFPDGAPASACQTMKPRHGYPEFPSQATPSPFKTEIPAGEYAVMDKAVRLELRSQDELSKFRGYFVIAFDKDDETKPIGTFQSPSDGKLINCTSNAMDAATHTSKEDKQLVTIDWIPPTNYLGTVIFRTSYVQNFSMFWAKTESIPVSFVMDVPATTTVNSKPSVAGPQSTIANTPSSASQQSTGIMWAGLVAAASLLLITPSRHFQC